jgi:iron complex outermembrane recepter protein
MACHELRAAVRRQLAQDRFTTVVPALALALCAAVPLQAQQTPQTPEEDPLEITVTGTRIRQETGMTTPVPVTSLSVDELSTFDPGAAIADKLDSLPQLFQTESAQRSSGALFGNAGGSYVNLRGLGSQRTLVLLDGSRVVPNDRVGAVNVGTFPTALVKSVDIVTGGASAQYGADAVGGVINFVIDRSFTGLKVSGGAGVTEFGDGENYNLSVAGGMKLGDRTHVIGSVETRSISQIMRDPTELGGWFNRTGFVTNPAWTAATAQQRIDGRIPRQLTLPNVISATHSPTGVINCGPAFANVCPASFSLNRFTFTNDGSGVRPFALGNVASVSGTGSTQSMSGGPEFNAGNTAFPGGPYGAEVKENSVFAGINHELTDSVSLFGQVLYGVSESNQPDQRGLPHLQDVWYATIYRENAFLPAAVRDAMTAQNVTQFRMDKLGQWLGAKNWNDSEEPRNKHEQLSWTVGLEAKLPADWNMRASWQSGQADKTTAVYDELRVDRMFLALDAVIDPVSGKTICNVQRFNPTPAQLAAAVSTRTSKFGGPLASPVGLDNTISGCVPLNPFGQGQVSDAARDYLVTDKFGYGRVNQDFAEVLFTGDVFEGWAGPIAAAVGGTYRAQSFWQYAYSGDGSTPVEALGPPLNAASIGIRGIPPGFTGGSANLHQFSTVPRISGGYHVWEVFGELQIPLFRTSGGQSMDLNTAYRRSEYSTSGSVAAYKMGLDFAVNDQLRLRGTYSRDVREATFSERFDQQGSGGSVTDPNFGRASFQITSVRGGNPNLLPELADTYTVGAVYRPNWLDGLQLSVDWYDINIQDAVGQLGLQRVVDDCSAGVTTLCQYVERDPTTGIIGRVFDYFLNVAQAKVEGVDIEIIYNTRPDFFSDRDERFSVRGFVSQLIERSNVTVPGAPVRQLGGGFTDSVLYPDWKGNLTVQYNLGDWGLQLSEEWISRSMINTTWVEGVDVDDNYLPNYVNTNARLSYSGQTEAGHQWDVGLTVTNLFDRNPIVVPSYNSRTGSQTVSNNYDAYGRRYNLGFNYSF